MKGLIISLTLGWTFLAGMGCGRKGPLQLPYSREPEAVENLVVFQRGDMAWLEWTNPRNNIDGHLPASLEEVEIWAGGESAENPSSPSVAPGLQERGRLVARISMGELATLSPEASADSGRMAYPVPVSSAGTGPVTFSVRVKANGGRLSEFSPPVSLTPRVCSLPPEGLEARIAGEAVELLWAAPIANVDGTRPAVVKGYRVYRSDGGRPALLLTAIPLEKPRFEDRDVEAGTDYRYFVRACSTAAPPFLESADSKILEITVVDLTPPAPPEGLAGISGEGFVVLSWKPSPERDLAGYRIWRSGEGGHGDVLLTEEALRENYFRDITVREDVPYTYSVTALDKNGNESAKSNPVTVRMKEGGM